jgi:hypothetical protein
VTLSTVAALSGATSAAWAVTDASWADGEVKRIDTAAICCKPW